MKNKLIVGFIVGMLTLTPITAYADDADLESRVAALEEKVATLEALIVGKDAIAETESDINTDSKHSITVSGYTLTYKECETCRDMWGVSSVLLHFDFINNSEETNSAGMAYLIKAYQNDMEIDFTSFDTPAASNWYREVRPGADPLNVAFGFKITSSKDVIVQIKPFMDDSVEPIEFTVSPQ